MAWDVQIKYPWDTKYAFTMHGHGQWYDTVHFTICKWLIYIIYFISLILVRHFHVRRHFSPICFFFLLSLCAYEYFHKNMFIKKQRCVKHKEWSSFCKSQTGENSNTLRCVYSKENGNHTTSETLHKQQKRQRDDNSMHQINRDIIQQKILYTNHFHVRHRRNK